MIFKHIKTTTTEINQRLDNVLKKYINKKQISDIYKKIRKKKYL